MSEKRNLNVDVEYLTRVEGHGNIVVDVKNGKLEKCQLAIVEAPRFFEGMLQGRSIFEAQHITSRICGICACGHTMASIQAAENAIGFEATEQTDKLRKFLLHMEILDSDLLHIYILAAPDLLGVKSFIPLIQTHNNVVRRGLRLKKTCNDVCDILVGRHVHPISTIVGGFTQLPDEEKIDKILALLYQMRDDMIETVKLFKTLDFPDFERETEYVGLVNDENEYPLLHGDIGTSDGVRFKKEDYKDYIKEWVEPHSSAKHVKLSRDCYAVGARANLNLNFDKLHEKAKSAAKELGFKTPCHNPYLNTIAQLIESYHCLEDSIEIMEDFKKNGIDYSEEIVVGLNEKNTIQVNAGRGVGAVIVPRGLLFHDYTVDENGTITDANCIIPTNQNVNNIEHDMKKLVPGILDKSDEDIQLYLEMLVRAYDPCISCSAHFLEVEFVNK